MHHFTLIVSMAVVGSVALVGEGADAYATRLSCATAPTWEGGAEFGSMGVDLYTASPGAVCAFSTPSSTDITCGGSVAVTLSTSNGAGYGMKVAVIGGATVSDVATSANTILHTSDVPNTCLGTSDNSGSTKVTQVELSIDTSAVVANGAVEVVGLCGGSNDKVMYVTKQTFNVIGCETDAPSSMTPTPFPTKLPTNTPTTGTPTKSPTEIGAGVSTSVALTSVAVACVSAVAMSIV